MHVQTVQPTQLAVSLDEVKDYLYVTSTDDDSLIQRLIFQAAGFLESRFKCAIMSQTWELHLDSWTDERYVIEGAIQVSRPPFGAVSSIKYLDTDGASQTLAASQYLVAAQGIYARIVPAKGVSWPSLYGVAQYTAVTITHTCGHATQSAVPYLVRQAIKDYCDGVYNNRSASMREEFLAQLDAEMSCVGAQIAYG